MREERDGVVSRPANLFVAAGSNVGRRHADGERDGHRDRRAEGAGRHEQQRSVRARDRARETAADVVAGAYQLKRGLAASEEAQVSKRLLRPTRVFSLAREIPRGPPRGGTNI